MLHSDLFLKIVAFLLVPASQAVKGFAASHTIAYQVADVVQGLAVALGIYSTTGREKRIE